MMNKIISKLKSLKLKIIRMIFQQQADLIIKELGKAEDEETFYIWFEQGAALNARMIINHGIYLN